MGLGARKATSEAILLKASLDGPTKSGKTFDSLVLATTIVKTLKDLNALTGNGKILVIDSEKDRSRLYADMFDFDHHPLYDFSPESYIETLKLAEEDNYSFTIVDQISHEWAGKGGTLEIKNHVEASSGGKLNSYTAWNPVTPRHSKFVESLVNHPTHIICTMRSKMDHVQEKNDMDKWIVRRVGLQPVQRDDTPYNFDVEMSLTQESIITVKTRGSLSRVIGSRAFHPGRDVDHPGDIVELGKLIANWLVGSKDANDGYANRTQIVEIQDLGEQLGFTRDLWTKYYAFHKISSLNSMTPELYEKIKKDMIKNISKKNAAKQTASQI